MVEIDKRATPESINSKKIDAVHIDYKQYAFFVQQEIENLSHCKLPPSLEEIKERYYTAAGRGDLQNSTDLVDVDAVWEWIEENLLNAIKTTNTKRNN